MTNKQFIQDMFLTELSGTVWLTEKDQRYADSYFDLHRAIWQSESISENTIWHFADKIEELNQTYHEMIKDSSAWITPRQRAANELIHDEHGNLTQDSIKLIQTAITDKNSEKTLVSDTGKTISFGEKWHQMINSCSFKAVAVDRLTDFISKFIEADGWTKYFVGNIGKNDKSLIQEYHVMDEYNLKHGTNYAAMHLGGNTRRCVLVSVDANTADGRGEPSRIVFLEIGAHTIIDRFIVGSFKQATKKPITEATTEDLAALFDI